MLGDDAGRITDDGTVCRLDDDSFYVTTTSSGADAVESWFAWWLAEWDLDVHLTDVSQGLAAFNLAGPRSREILSGLTDLDCSNESFAYLDGKRAQVAGVPCLLLRIGFVGELGYELHCPAALAEHALGRDPGRRRAARDPALRARAAARAAAAEAPHPRRPGHRRGVQPARGGDAVDRQARQGGGLHRPLGAGGGAASAAAENMLVGFTIDNGAVPSEGAAVVADGEPVGRVTSSRFSPLLERTIGMAWVPAALAEDGGSITLADDGRRLRATVQTAPFYDPDQERLRG